MDDLIERLRTFPDNVLEGAGLCDEAADELDRLRRELAEARAVIQWLEQDGLKAEALLREVRHHIWHETQDGFDALVAKFDAFLTPSPPAPERDQD